MGVGQRGYGLVPLRKAAQRGNGGQQHFAYAPQALAHEYYIRVVANVAGGRAKVDYGLCVRAGRAVGQHMGHNVVPHLVLAGGGEVAVPMASSLFHA